MVGSRSLPLGRNKYIDEKLGKTKDARATQGDAADDPLAALRSEEDALYALPEHLNPQVPTASLGAGDENGNGGVLLWSTGIAEVELPETFKEKTVAATKRALERARTARPGVSSALPTNFSTDFNRQRRDYVAELKSLPKGAMWLRPQVCAFRHTDACVYSWLGIRQTRSASVAFATVRARMD